MLSFAPTFRPASRFTRALGSARTGFTLIEILIVVIILGILAAIVIPQFSNASQLTRQNTLKDELRYLRMQIVVYNAQHLDISPGYPGDNPTATPTSIDFMSEMTQYTDDRGNGSATYSDIYQYGPYLTQMPMDPVNSFASITLVPNGTSMPSPDGTTGFLYQPQTQTIIPNVIGNDSDGVPYSSY